MSLSYTGNIAGTFYEANGWTEADHARLHDLVAEGLSSAEIGRRMGRTKCSVIGRIRRRGLKLKREPSGGILRLSKGKPGKPRSGGGARAVKTATVRSTPAPQVNQVPEPLPPAVPAPPQGRQPAALSRPAPGPAFRTCQYPRGTRETGWDWCGAPVVPGRPYCLVHQRLCWQAPPRHREDT